MGNIIAFLIYNFQNNAIGSDNNYPTCNQKQFISSKSFT